MLAQQRCERGQNGPLKHFKIASVQRVSSLARTSSHNPPPQHVSKSAWDRQATDREVPILLQPRSKSAAARDFKTSKNLGELVRAGLTFSVVGSLFDPGAPRRSSLGLDGADETGLPRTESPSPVFARVRVGALDAARPDRRAVTVFVDRKTGCREETTIFAGTLAHEANGSTHSKRQYQPLGSNRQCTCKISSGSMLPCCEFKLLTQHPFYRSESMETPAVAANE